MKKTKGTVVVHERYGSNKQSVPLALYIRKNNTSAPDSSLITEPVDWLYKRDCEPKGTVVVHEESDSCPRMVRFDHTESDFYIKSGKIPEI